MPMQRGFTLIELLVVIGILGLLAAAFLPDLIGGRDTANITETGLRQQFLVNGINAYKSANGTVPPNHAATSPPPVVCSMVEAWHCGNGAVS